MFLRYTALGHPGSVHLYFLSDQFQGYLVRHAATNHASTHPESLETWVTPRDHFTLAKPPHPNNRLQHIQVSHTHTHCAIKFPVMCTRALEAINLNSPIV